jgi:NADPH:quinone reductase
MKAGWYETNGAARDVLFVSEVETPSPGPGEVLVRVAVSGANPSDVKSRAGRPPAFPRIIPNSDGAGTIEAVGEGVDETRIGRRVWLWNGQWKRAFGTAAEYICLPQAQAVDLPDEAGFDAGALMGIPGLTAIHAVNLLGDVSGKTLLVTGAASSVGHYATQIAAMRGARVIGTASAVRKDHAMSAGASETIDYLSEDVAARIGELTGGKGVDGIIDMDLSSTARLLSKNVLAQHGKHVCYGSNNPGEIPLPFLNLLWSSLTLQVFLVYELKGGGRRTAIEQLNSLLREDRLIHTVGARYPLSQIAHAHEAVEGGKVIGNVVLDCG